MKHGICLLTMVPMRSEPSHRSEMVNQMLFGEVFDVIGRTRNGEWLEIRLRHDKYEGWVDAIQVQLLEKDEVKRITQTEPSFSRQTIDLCVNESNKLTTFLVPGSQLWLPDGQDHFSVNDDVIRYEGQALKGNQLREEMINFAFGFINAPYLWGGRTPLGIDCSGFSQIVYRMCGHFIPRDASQQAGIGTALGFLEESKPGDLAFFDNAEGRIIHVGIILPGNQIIHASGTVRVDGLDQYGIYHKDKDTHTHRLRLIKSIVE